MYRSLLNPRERAGAVVAVVAVHAAILLALLAAGQRSAPAKAEEASLELFDVIEQPDPPVVEQVEQVNQEPAPDDEGAASPPNVVSRASPVTAPEPVVVVPPVSEVTASPTPAEGSEPTQGAAPDPGPGTGAGGAGSGTGSGGAGSGSRGGGLGGTRPRLLSGQFRTRHYPRELQRAWELAGPVLVTFRVRTDGRATDCRVFESSGNLEIDRETCRLAEARLRFRPATDEQGRPYEGSYGYRQAPTGQ